ncbi:hypothetical protein ACFE04_013344 [Oxalis oulophora]
MNLSMSAAYKQVVNYPGVMFNMDPFFRWKDKVVVVMGATGTGKSRLAIDLATRFPAEIINSDKIQVYKGLDICTNKITEEESRGVPHHLLGFLEPDSNFTSQDFTHHASLALESVVARDKLPIIAGGSNSYIDALVNHCPEFLMKYECCFLWVDVSFPVLNSFVSDRVDKMVEAGLIEEVRKIFDPNQADYSSGIRRAIGVPELDQYFRTQGIMDTRSQNQFLDKAIAKIKDNTCALARRQIQKIRRLYSKSKRNNMYRIDATEVFLKRGDEAEEAWKNRVMDPTAMMVAQFLYDEEIATPTLSTIATPQPIPMAAVAMR